MKKLLVLILALLIPASVNALTAFPGAEGWGKDTVGGRSGSAKLYKVNTLSDGSSGSCSGNICSGTLRYALQSSGPRIIIFTVSGTIALSDDIWVINGNVTIAGQTSPGGVQIRNGGIKFESTSQVIVRGLKIRPGDSPGGPIANGGRDGMTNLQSSYIVFDHNTMNFSCDTGLGGGNDPLNHWTLSYNLLAYSLNNDCSDYDPQLMLIADPGNHPPYVTQVTVSHNLLAHSKVRTPGVKQGTEIEAINNVVYNVQSGDWASWTGSKGAWIGNYWKNGPLKPSGFLGLAIKDMSDGMEWSLLNASSPDVYIAHSICPDRPTDSGSETLCLTGRTQYYNATNQLTMSGITIDSPTDAYTKVLGAAGSGAGAYQRDSLETTVISNVLNGTGISTLCATEEDCGGYPTLSGSYPTDTDGDGIPDSWETSHGLNPNSSSDALTYAPSGYLWIEEYINSFFPTEGGGDTTPPDRYNSTPGTLPPGTTQTNITLTTSENATCKYSTTPGTSYVNMTNTFSGGGTSSHSAVVGSTTYSDDFNRSNENPLSGGGNWTVAGSSIAPILLSSNVVAKSSSSSQNGSYYAGASFADDQCAELKLASGGDIGPMVRIQTGQTYLSGYALGYDIADGLIAIIKYDGIGNVEWLDSVSGTMSNGDIQKICVNGTAITAYKNGSPITGLSATDSTFTSGRPGIYSWALSSGTGDDWSASGGAGTLTDGTTYHFYTRCVDSVGNANTDDYDISFTVGGGGGGGVQPIGSFVIQGVLQ
jgi:hypothetical protein